ncbi:hypothetical protein [Spiroplasma citri]|uniref:Plectrovirus svts2 rep protein n=1 Tax=Spiroplasma citri TaxID=2133 RepID=A0AAJ4EKD4_SPICI|nr:hypothetical protein [Spiroplasma citri]APE75269.1 plectrovirus-related protein [Spiroplasma citri]QIA67524.1 plectrovirus svts2 rep protein [Spiroplasma citri]QIA69380.1 plectrovirus svts2 rep protein [Spiroplasma citri]QIA71245.1 plectrovirus svts2 rep protein [Spiroplasma citri]QIA73352.1 plectrovirus svts2 rep protein [Spiroplasma citri]
MENNININAYNRLTKENLYRPYIDNSNFINKKYYVKKVYYGNYVKNIVLPLECVDSFGNGNPTGIKNNGKNETKLLNSRVRSQGNCIRKAIHNFSDCKELGFLTLTYAEKMQDLDKANYHFNLFIKKLKYHFSKYKKNTFINLKYLVVYEYQDRKGIPIIHFHIIFNRFISSNLIREYWPYGINKNLKVKKNTNVFVIKYLTKYFVKSLSNTERQKKELCKEFDIPYKKPKKVSEVKLRNIYNLNKKSYRFSANCTDPLVKVGIIEMCEMELIASLKGIKNKFMFVDKQGYIMGVSIDSYLENDYFWQIEEYVPFYRKQYQHWKEQKLFFENYKKRHKKSISLHNNLLIQ